jgi:hypothetical protein
MSKFLSSFIKGKGLTFKTSENRQKPRIIKTIVYVLIFALQLCNFHYWHNEWVSEILFAMNGFRQVLNLFVSQKVDRSKRKNKFAVYHSAKRISTKG